LSNLKDHALREFKAAGWTDESGKFNDEMQEMICNHVLKLIDLFSEEGHSGSTAPYAINLFRRLAMFEPVSPLTGADDEWFEHDYGDTPTYQNKRMGSVFKHADRFDGQAYWLDGKVFWEWATADDLYDGKPFKSYFTSRDSMVTIEFPWTKPENPEYVFVPTEQFPNEVLS
jgi:hypothetical protein